MHKVNVALIHIYWAEPKMTPPYGNVPRQSTYSEGEEDQITVEWTSVSESILVFYSSICHRMNSNLLGIAGKAMRLYYSMFKIFQLLINNVPLK